MWFTSEKKSGELAIRFDTSLLDIKHRVRLDCFEKVVRECEAKSRSGGLDFEEVFLTYWFEDRISLEKYDDFTLGNEWLESKFKGETVFQVMDSRYSPALSFSKNRKPYKKVGWDELDVLNRPKVYAPNSLDYSFDCANRVELLLFEVFRQDTTFHWPRVEGTFEPANLEIQKQYLFKDVECFMEVRYGKAPYGKITKGKRKSLGRGGYIATSDGTLHKIGPFVRDVLPILDIPAPRTGPVKMSVKLNGVARQWEEALGRNLSDDQSRISPEALSVRELFPVTEVELPDVSTLSNTLNDFIKIVAKDSVVEAVWGTPLKLNVLPTRGVLFGDWDNLSAKCISKRLVSFGPDNPNAALGLDSTFKAELIRRAFAGDVSTFVERDDTKIEDYFMKKFLERVLDALRRPMLSRYGFGPIPWFPYFAIPDYIISNANEVAAIPMEVRNESGPKGRLWLILPKELLNIFAAAEKKGGRHPVDAPPSSSVPRLQPDKPLFTRSTRYSPLNIARVLRNNYAYVQAAVLGSLNPVDAAEIFVRLPKEEWGPVVLALCTAGNISNETLHELDGCMSSIMDKEKRVLDCGASKPGKRLFEPGPKTVADILCRVDRLTFYETMTVVEAVSAKIARVVMDSYFEYEDLVRLDDSTLARVLEEISEKVMPYALKILRDEDVERMLSVLPMEKAQRVRVVYRNMPPVRLSIVEQAVEKVMTAVRRLDSEGKIVIPKGIHV